MLGLLPCFNIGKRKDAISGVKRWQALKEAESSEYVKQIMDVINEETPDKTSAVADAVVFWRCVY